MFITLFTGDRVFRLVALAAPRPLLVELAKREGELGLRHFPPQTFRDPYYYTWHL